MTGPGAKASSYGTILCDLERGRRVDLLPDRTAETLAAWLKDHPSVEIVVRDRAGAYADGSPPGSAAGHSGRRPVACDLRVFGNHTFPTIRKV